MVESILYPIYRYNCLPILKNAHPLAPSAVEIPQQRGGIATESGKCVAKNARSLAANNLIY